jgi:hypothetical protein
MSILRLCRSVLREKVTLRLMKLHFNIVDLAAKLSPTVRIKLAEHTSLIHYITNYLEQNKTEKKPRTK